MGFFTFGKKRGERGQIALVFDIGSSSVGAGLFLLHKNKSHVLLYSTRKRIRAGRSHDINHLVTKMKKSLTAVAENMSKEGLQHLTFTSKGSKKVDHIYLMLSGTWNLSRSSHVSYIKERPFEVTKGFIEKLIAKEVKQFETNEMFESSSDIKLLERAVSVIRLNGYATSTPEGKEAKSLSLDMYASMCPESLYKEIEYIVGAQFHTDSVSAHTFAFAVTKSLNKHPEDDFALIDVTGVLSEVILVEDGSIVATASFTFGAHEIVRRVARKANMTIEEIESLLEATDDILVHDVRQKKLRDAVDEVKEEWLLELEESVRELPDFLSLPSYLYITGNEDTATIIQYFLENPGEKKAVLNPSSHVTAVSKEMFIHDVKISSGAKEDLFLLCEGVYAGMLLEE